MSILQYRTLEDPTGTSRNTGSESQFLACLANPFLKLLAKQRDGDLGASFASALMKCSSFVQAKSQGLQKKIERDENEGKKKKEPNLRSGSPAAKWVF